MAIKMIFANHAHVFPEALRADGSIAVLKDFMKECGIDKCICFAPFMSDFWPMGDYANPNIWLAHALKDEPDLFGFGTIDFNKDNFEEQVDEIAALGLKGIKLHPPHQAFCVDGKEAFRVYARAQLHDLFISFHCGIHWNRIKGTEVIRYNEIAYNFPSLRFSLEHVGGYSFFNEGLAVIENNTKRGIVQPRVYAGLTTIRLENGKFNTWSISDEQLQTLFYMTSTERSIFGLDFPYHPPEDIIDDIKRIRRLVENQEDADKILGGNLAKALGIEI